MKAFIRKKLSAVIAAVCLTASLACFNVSAADLRSLYIGDHITFIYQGDITLVSDDPQIAAVKNDTSVYGVSEGIATVNAVYPDGTVYKTYDFAVSSALSSYYIGDVNSDDEVDTTDITILQEYFTKQKPVVMNFAAGDIDENGKTDIFDIIYLKRLVAYGIYPGEPEPEVTTAPAVTTVTTQTTVTKATTTVSTTADPAQQAAEKAAEILSLVNKERAAVGAAPLELNQTMCDAAMVRAMEISEVFSHTRPDGTDCFTIFDDYGLSWNYVGENIAAGNSTSEGTMNQWVNSSGHYANIISGNFTEIGVGYVYVPGTQYGYYWVQLFR
ncbi:MAG: CAP domain-containing protein [Porcipelethomonas sp.]